MNAVKLKTLVYNKQTVPFYNKINLWSIVDEVAVGHDLQMSVGLELFDEPDISIKEEVEVETHLALIQKLLHSVPENVTLQFVTQVREGDPEKIQSFVDLGHKNNPSQLGKMVLEEKQRFLSGKFIQRKRSFLFITTYHQALDKIPTLRLTSLLIDSPAFFVASMHQARVKEINAIANNVCDSLRGLQVKSRRLNDSELAQYFYDHLNPLTGKDRGLPNLAKHSAHMTARSALALSAAEQKFSQFTLDGIHHKAVNLLILPERLEALDLASMMNHLWPDYDLCLSVHIVNSDKMIEKLKRSANISKSLSFSNLGSHYEAEQKYIELDELIREIRSTSQKVFTFSCCLLFKERDIEKLETNVSLGVKSFQELGSATGIVDNLNHEDLFLSFLPNHSHFNSRKHVIHTDPLANLIPLTASWRGTDKPKMLFENPQGELVNMDLFDPSLPSKHALLVGSTGSGKSFSTNYLLTNFMIESHDNHVVIIDIGGSYRKLCEIFNGQYLSVELSDQFAFNPFPKKVDILKGKEFDSDSLAFLTLILERMILDQNEILTSSGESLIEKAIQLAYKNKDLSEAPILKDIRDCLEMAASNDETKVSARHFSNNLEMWVDGRYARIFNTQNQLQVDNRLIVFDLEKLSHHPRLQSVYFYVIREIIHEKLKNMSLKKMIVIDEGWRFFNDDIGARLIENLYRTARKNNGMILSISQSPLDFLNTKAANSIVTNSYVKYVLRLTKGHDLLPQFGFTNAEVGAIKNLTSVPKRFSDVFLKFNDVGTVIRLEPSPQDYWICTTDAEDRVKEMKLRAEHPNWEPVQVLQELAKRMASEGAEK